MLSSLSEVLEQLKDSDQKPKVALDTNCVQYYISDPPAQPWADCLDPVFWAAHRGDVELYVSTVVVAELLSKLHFQHRGTGYDPELDLLSIINRHFRMLEVDDTVAKAAGRLRGTYIPDKKMALETPDALIGATCLVNGLTLFITNDERLAKALPPESCIYLKEVALKWLEQHFASTCVKNAPLVQPSRRGAGLSVAEFMDDHPLGAVRPPESATWRRLLADACAVANVLNIPCLFFLLCHRNGRRITVGEVLLWHEGLEERRPTQQLLKHLREHLEVRLDRARDSDVVSSNKQVFIFCFSSLTRERARQSQPCFASKTDLRKTADAWKNYLAPLWRFREALSLPQTTWLLCEDGVARYLNADAARQFLDRANNVLGWEEGR